MAFYDYKCPECKHVQEESHSMKDDPVILCKKCQTQMKRIISGGTGFIMKGGTVRANVRQRHGKKKKFSTPTPGESAISKATEATNNRKSAFDPSNPYKEFK
jgi:putative FmdB family regulatory protein